MSSLQPVQTALAAIASLPGRLPGGPRDVAVAGLWISAIAFATAMAFLFTGLAWLACTAGVAGMVLAGQHTVKRQARLRLALARAERERAAMEQALREAQKMAALGRLAVGVAHDFNNHLTVISNNVEMVVRKLDTGHDRLRRYTDAAIQGVQRAAALTSRLLSFSRQSPPEPETIDVDRLLTDLSDLLRRTLGNRVGLEVRLSGEPWFTQADVSQMENVLLSLVVNARDQVPDGGVLTLAVTNVRLDKMFVDTIRCIAPGDYIQVAVGVAATQEPPSHWRAVDNLTRADLLMARAAVQEAGGCLLRSDGPSLRIFLPRHLPPLVVTNAPRSKVGGRPTVLVVEDDPSVRAVCVETLTELNYQVLEAPDAMEAFRLIADRGGIDLLFTDLGLPGGVSGRALADAARNLDPRMRVLFTTGSGCTDLPNRVSSALLRKPFDPVQLAAKVRDVMAAEQPVGQSETVKG
jgi:CheY-like chemotaxis protein